MSESKKKEAGGLYKSARFPGSQVGVMCLLIRGREGRGGRGRCRWDGGLSARCCMFVRDQAGVLGRN